MKMAGIPTRPFPLMYGLFKHTRSLFIKMSLTLILSVYMYFLNIKGLRGHLQGNTRPVYIDNRCSQMWPTQISVYRGVRGWEGVKIAFLLGCSGMNTFLTHQSDQKVAGWPRVGKPPVYSVPVSPCVYIYYLYLYNLLQFTWTLLLHL